MIDRTLAATTIRTLARNEGFPLAGIAPATRPSHFDRFRRWVTASHHAGMNYLARSLTLRADPALLLPGASSVLCFAAPYAREAYRTHDGVSIARYARGEDYHRALRRRLLRLCSRIAEEVDSRARFRVCIDSAPLLERDFAAAAGIGWIGKNGCLLNEQEGSFLLLAEVLTDLDLPPDEPAAERCGSCVACLEACPTSAFLEPGLLDARRCLSYWTIEHRGPVPDEIKSYFGDRLFGCDICQEVCPWNGRLDLRSGLPSIADRPSLIAGDSTPDLRDWLTIGSGRWRRDYARTALARAGKEGMRRNATIVAGATGRTALLPVIERLTTSRNSGVRDAARWAVSRLTVLDPLC